MVSRRSLTPLAGLPMIMVVACARGAGPTEVGASREARTDLSGCYRVDERLGDGLVQIGKRVVVPEAFEEDAVFCLDARGFYVKPSARRTPSHWYRLDGDWQEEPILRHQKQVGISWTSEPAIDPDDPCRHGSMNICCIGGCSVKVPEAAFRFTRIEENVRVALVDGSTGVSLVRLPDSDESVVRREIAAARFVEARGRLALERAIESGRHRKPTIDLDSEEDPLPTKQTIPKRCPNDRELVADACLEYCAKPAADATAHLSVNSIPQAWVLLDGCLLGMTPQISHPVKPGAHEVTFVHDERGRILRRFEVRDGKKTTVAVKFD